MDIYESEGLSWADQWDPQPLHPETEEEKKKKAKEARKGGKMGKKLLSFSWIKNLGKKSQK